jgi:hypothetical protein
MNTQIQYTFGSVVDRPLPETRQLVADALRAEGFGILTEIDVQATLGLVGPGPVGSVAAEARERLQRVAGVLEAGR